MKAMICGVLLATMVMGVAIAQESAKQEVIVPQEKMVLLNGKDLSGWYTWLTGTGRADPKQVFTMQENGELRISGDGYGGLTTEREYANYHLVVEYRWGKETWAPRKTAARDGGVLLHCQGHDGNYGGTIQTPGPWMNSLECQIIEGGVGDLLVLEGLAKDGSVMKATATCEVSKDRDGEAIWTVGGKKEAFTAGRVNWFGRDPDWKDVIDYRGSKDVESAGQEWTRLECYCHGDNLTYVVNGVVVNRASQVFPRQGKILLQTEGAEMFVRKVELYPLPENLP